MTKAARLKRAARLVAELPPPPPTAEELRAQLAALEPEERGVWLPVEDGWALVDALDVNGPPLRTQAERPRPEELAKEIAIVGSLMGREADWRRRQEFRTLLDKLQPPAPYTPPPRRVESPIPSRPVVPKEPPVPEPWSIGTSRELDRPWHESQRFGR